ncbi:transcription antitermination factor NusB [Yeguia hominis]|uniref:Transcription antitermination protein NusB n=1 Tax=Yeguia hominis TaxID=2763662 RepID=A0A926D8I7_9FIRM|nr:transcription antitermination factor NusB [Yeguia hominis]MBC8533738.1 transcription antitermination factor NusB [Yeguia hominis]
MKRREEREIAFAIGFERSVTGESVAAVIDGAEDVRECVIPTFSASLASGVEQNEAEIDEKISRNIRGWTIDRLSKVTLSILRLAIYEMCYETEIPVSVSINEAVELAKLYGDTEDAPFVNGVLSTVAKELHTDHD